MAKRQKSLEQLLRWSKRRGLVVEIGTLTRVFNADGTILTLRAKHTMALRDAYRKLMEKK
jgi:hypothetical protein